MALTFGKKDTRVVEISASEPLDDGKTKLHSFKAEFKKLPKQNWDVLIKDKDTLLIDFAIENLVDVQGVVDGDGNEMPYNDTVKQALFDERWLHEPLNDAFMAVQTGKTSAEYKKLKAKN